MKSPQIIILILISSLSLMTSCGQGGQSRKETQSTPPQVAEDQIMNNQPTSIPPNNEITGAGRFKAQQQTVESKEETIINNNEEYEYIGENPFQIVKNNPLSTFSIDVDTASYSNMRRFLNNNQLPPPDAIRIEELINYFDYEYPQPTDKPFSIVTEIGENPWNKNHKLVQIGLQGKDISSENLPPSNLVFLLDVSGSMNDPNKLPLLKSGFELLVNQLRENDRVSLVVYAGAAGVVLPPTSGKEKDKILAAINNLEAGGSTAGGEGIQLAYKIAEENLLTNGNNRVILATDGDFNVGLSSDSELIRLIENERQKGIFLTVLGFGSGNLKDATMEKLADKGNGNYAYIDSILEAQKVLVKEMGGTLFTIAKDVKIQVEFNPGKVKAYRLIGYENRRLQDQDFNDDTKDAGELGAGHTVTALYEIIPVGVETNINLPNTDDLRYQQQNTPLSSYTTEEIMLVKLRYKEPKNENSALITETIKDSNTKLSSTSNNFRFAAAVAEFGLLLRDDKYKSDANFTQVLELANNAKNPDLNNYRAEFINLVQKAQIIKN